MTKHDFVETNGSSAIAALPLLAAGVAMPVEGFGWALGQAFLVFLALRGLIANQCHKWGHMRQAELGPVVRLSQQMRLVLSPAIHRHHHARLHNSHYCTANGWMNGPLETGGFFRGLERMLPRTRADPTGSAMP